MRPTSTRFRHGAAALVATAFAAFALVACGSDDEEQQLGFELDKSGVINGPQSAESGVAEITLDNQSDSEGDLQLIRTEGDRSVEEVVEAFEGTGSGKPLPDWFFGGGGVGSTPAGKSATVTQVLQPGTYFAVNTEGQPQADRIATLEVSGDATDETVEGEGEATVSAGEYVFESEAPLPSGENEIVFDNVGAQPHHLLASRLIGDATAEDVEAFFKTEKGKPPLSENGTQATAVIEGGEGQVVTLDLEPGRYAFYCFISDRQGGPPHALKGMVDEIEVE